MNAGPRNGVNRPLRDASPLERLLAASRTRASPGDNVVQRVDEGVAVAKSRWGHVMQSDMAKPYIRK